MPCGPEQSANASDDTGQHIFNNIGVTANNVSSLQRQYKDISEILR